ncbi:MAG TPA: molybdate ABC transporter substrate-binding protein [Rhizomicrobium sp.]|nr:molybdate ABC transporter substrate-binding protein [Rhizomicrobium sp.]
MHALRAFVLAALALTAALAPSVAFAADITVFAAASLTDALNEINTAWTKETSHSAAMSFAASSALARQVEAGAPADAFISADTDWMDYLDHRNLIQRQTRKDLLGNHLVLIEPASSPAQISIAPRFDLAGALAGGRLAVADPDSVPAGKYAKAALTALGVWDSVATRLASAENVRMALKYVARGDAPLGIVYTTDAISEPQVRIAGTFPDATHPPIVYPVALTTNAKPLARDFLSYLTGAHAGAIFRKDGFVVLNGVR